MTRVYRLKTQLAWKSPLISHSFVEKEDRIRKVTRYVCVKDYGELFKVNKKSKINLAFTVGKYVQTVFWEKEWYCIFQTYQAHTLTLNHQVSIAPQAVELMVDRSKTRSWKKKPIWNRTQELRVVWKGMATK